MGKKEKDKRRETKIVEILACQKGRNTRNRKKKVKS